MKNQNFLVLKITLEQKPWSKRRMVIVIRVVQDFFFALCLVSWLGPKANLKLCSGKSRHFLKVFLLSQKYGWTFSKQYFRSCAQTDKNKEERAHFS